jgi:hypothetical protein
MLMHYYSSSGGSSVDPKIVFSIRIDLRIIYYVLVHSGA